MFQRLDSRGLFIELLPSSFRADSTIFSLGEVGSVRRRGGPIGAVDVADVLVEAHVILAVARDSRGVRAAPARGAAGRQCDLVAGQRHVRNGARRSAGGRCGVVAICVQLDRSVAGLHAARGRR